MDDEGWVTLGTYGEFEFKTSVEDVGAGGQAGFAFGAFQQGINEWAVTWETTEQTPIHAAIDKTWAWVDSPSGPLPLPHQCWHCERDRHDGPLTEIVAAMWEQHKWDENYDPDLDYSPIVCLGSDAIGPARAHYKKGTWVNSGNDQAVAVDFSTFTPPGVYSGEGLVKKAAEQVPMEDDEAEKWSLLTWPPNPLVSSWAEFEDANITHLNVADFPDITSGTPGKVAQIAGHYVYINEEDL